jgi:hypothetical protein
MPSTMKRYLCPFISRAHQQRCAGSYPMREETWQHSPFSVLLPRVLHTGEGAPYGGQRGPDHPTPIRESGTAWLTSKIQNGMAHSKVQATGKSAESAKMFPQDRWVFRRRQLSSDPDLFIGLEPGGRRRRARAFQGKAVKRSPKNTILPRTPSRQVSVDNRGITPPGPFSTSLSTGAVNLHAGDFLGPLSTTSRSRLIIA